MRLSCWPYKVHPVCTMHLHIPREIERLACACACVCVCVCLTISGLWYEHRHANNASVRQSYHMQTRADRAQHTTQPSINYPKCYGHRTHRNDHGHTHTHTHIALHYISLHLCKQLGLNHTNHPPTTLKIHTHAHAYTQSQNTSKHRTLSHRA